MSNQLKIFALQVGLDWSEAYVEHYINLTDRTGKQLRDEYFESGGYEANGKKHFKEWAIGMGYCREPNPDELEIIQE